MITELEKQFAIDAINARLRIPQINMPGNEGVKEGFTEAIQALEKRYTSYDQIMSRSEQARCIVALTIDFIKEEIPFQIIERVPIKGYKETPVDNKRFSGSKK